MNFRKKILLLFWASTLSFNSCSSMDSVIDFFKDPMKSSIFSVVLSAPIFSFVSFKLGSCLFTRDISKNYEEQKKINEKALKQNNDLADRNQKQQSCISSLQDENENLKNKIKSLKEESDFYRDNLYSVYDQVEKYSKCILEGKNKINEIKQGISL